MNLETLIEQENTLRFTSFDSEVALELCLEIIKLVKERQYKSVGIQVYYDNKVVLHYLMKDRKESPWLDKKRKTVLESGHSSYFVALSQDDYSDYTQWKTDESYGLAGGGFPIYVNDELQGAVCVSGLTQDLDHEVVVDSLSKILATR